MRRILAAAAALAATPAFAEDLSVTIDQTRMLDMDRPVATLVVGNPSCQNSNTYG